ncbi:MAG: murein biosynthesis integral membrane protein MurJ [Rhodocyclaceae bacterium]|nr:murein biosynthesis integral membrane protein MurJ [Rhodocyclaceae bacterium]
MNLLRALVTVSGMTLISRVLGFVRDFVIARTFGAGMATDAYVVASRLPNLLRRMFAEGAFSQAFVPVLGEYHNRRGQEETKRLVDHVATLLGLATFLVTLVGMIATPALIWLTAPGFSAEPDKFALTVTLTRITFPYMLCMSLVALAGGILNTWGRFSVPAFTPVLLNLVIIVMALFATPYFNPPVLVLAWAMFGGGVLQLLWQAPHLAKIGMLPRFSFSLKDAGVNRIMKLMLPALFGVSISQISLVINTIFVSFLPTGSVSWLYYADRLMEFPSGLLGAALGTILLPSLSRSHAQGNREEFSGLLDWGLRLTLMLTLPAALAMAILAVPLVSTLFQHGAFTTGDALQTKNAVVAYSVGLAGLILVKILAPAFYSRQDVRTPVKIGLLTLAVTQVMNLAFILPLHHAGLALATGLASCLNAGLLFRGLRRQAIYLPLPGWRSFSLKLVLALAALALVLWFGSGAESWWLQVPTASRVLRLSFLIVAGIATYFATLFILGFRPRDFQRRGAA